VSSSLRTGTTTEPLAVVRWLFEITDRQALMLPVKIIARQKQEAVYRASLLKPVEVINFAITLATC